MRTPWGRAQSVQEVAPGVLVVDTAGHGGIKLDRARNAKIPAATRIKGGFYEEDCEVGIVFAVHADVASRFKVQEDKNALSLASWLPASYVALRDAGFVKPTAQSEERLAQPLFPTRAS